MLALGYLGLRGRRPPASTDTPFALLGPALLGLTVLALLTRPWLAIPAAIAFVVSEWRTQPARRAAHLAGGARPLRARARQRLHVPRHGGVPAARPAVGRRLVRVLGLDAARDRLARLDGRLDDRGAARADAAHADRARRRARRARRHGRGAPARRRLAGRARLHARGARHGAREPRAVRRRAQRRAGRRGARDGRAARRAQRRLVGRHRARRRAAAALLVERRRCGRPSTASRRSATCTTPRASPTWRSALGSLARRCPR